ncbi:MAG TPA: PAS domain S-box protein [Leptolyngbyaceae cyanobacterium]
MSRKHEKMNENLQAELIKLSTINKRLEAKIKERRKNESTLQKAVEEIWELYNNAPCGYHSLDDGGKFIEINDTHLEWLGYTREEVIGKMSFTNLIMPEDWPVFDKAFAELKKNGKLQEIEFKIIRRNGTIMPVLLSARSLYDREGNFVKSHATVFDITERKQFESTLKRRDDILEAVAYTAEQLLKASNWQQSINQVLERLGRAAEASRVYIFKNKSSNDRTILTSMIYEWVERGIPPLINHPVWHNIDINCYGYDFVDKLSRGETCFGITNKLDRVLQKVLSSFDILSIAIVPIFVNQNWWGFIGFNDCWAEREWSSVGLDALQAAANLLGAAISRQESEEALRASEERFRNLVETSSDLVWEVDENTRCTYISPKIKEIFGYEPEEVLGKTLFDFMTLKEATNSKTILSSIVAIAGRKPFKSLEAKQNHKDGSQIFLETSGVPIFLPDGKFCGYRGIARDITMRKHTEEALRQRGEALRWSQERLELATVAGNVGVWDWNIQTNEIYIDTILKTQLGYTELDIENNLDSWYSLIHPEDREKVLAAINEHLQGLTEQYEIEYRRLHRDGSIRWFISRGTAIWDDNNKPYRMAGADTDITQRKQTEEELQRLSIQNELILNSAGEGIIGLDTAGNITFANPAAAKMLGYEVTELIDRPLYDRLHHSQPNAAYYQMDDSPIYIVLKDGVARNKTDELFWRKDGSNFLVEYVITPIIETLETSNNQLTEIPSEDLSGSISFPVIPSSIKGAVVTFRDISERRVVERMKDEFISVVSHELRTPLTSIRGSLGLLFSGKLGELSENGHRMLKIAVNNTDRLVRLINDILDLERMESGKIQMHKQFCDPFDLITAAVELMQGMADKAEVNLLAIAPAENKEIGSKQYNFWPNKNKNFLKKSQLPLLYADSDRLTQVLTNLLSNAIKFSPPGTAVYLSAELQTASLFPTERVEKLSSALAISHPPLILFKIKDQGRGIPSDKLESIFGRFQQVDASDSRTKGGTGLGLAICQSIVLAHGGRIWVESSVGEGSTFYFTIPIDRQ